MSDAKTRPGKLFEPCDLGGIEVPNRLVKSAMAENLCDGQGGPTDRMIRVYGRWAKGGTGLLITGNAAILPGQGFSTLNLEFGRESALQRMALLADAVHEHGARIVVQLYHPGSQIPPKRAGDMEVVSSSRRLSRVNLCTSRALTPDEIRGMIRAFGDSALRARECGFDGIQVHAAHGYLHTQFLSPHYNARTDEWGGSRENRRRFLIGCVREIRDRTGPDFPILVKLNATDGVSDGVTFEEVIETSQALEGAGCNAIEFSGGCGETAFGFYAEKGGFPADLAREYMSAQGGLSRVFAAGVSFVQRRVSRQIRFSPCYFLDPAIAAKKALTIPVIAVGGFRKRSEMDEAVDTGKVDLVSLARPLVREPRLPKRIRESEGEVAAVCTSCNRCYLSVGLDRPLRCYASTET